MTPESIGPGVLFPLLFVALALATWLLLRSLHNQLRKVPRSFGPDDREER